MEEAVVEVVGAEEDKSNYNKRRNEKRELRCQLWK